MFQILDWLPDQTFEPRRYQPGNIGNWSGHLPFAHDLLLASRPSLLVELGTHLGESYFGFCQTIAEHNLPCLAYAVDSWEGEPHAGFYDETVYNDVECYNRANYQQFSYLLKMLFDEALNRFSPNSIDVLHIDGLHTFDAVSHDFHSWLPKVKPGGIVLLHDVVVRHHDFGVWKLWEKLKEEGETFEFRHSWGLGVFRKPGGGDGDSEFLQTLFKADGRTREKIRRWYELLAFELKRKHHGSGMDDEELSLQVYLPSSEGYNESLTQRSTLRPATWSCLTVELLNGIGPGLLRLDPGEVPAIVDIRGIFLQSAVDGQTVWSATGPELDALTVGGTLVPTPGEEANDAKRFFSYGIDPQLFLPPLEHGKVDQPLILKLWVRIQPDLSGLVPVLGSPINRPETSSQEEMNALTTLLATHQSNFALDKAEMQAAVDRLTEQLNDTTEKLNDTAEKLTASETEREKLIGDVNRQQTRIYLLEEIRKQAKKDREELEELQSKNLDSERTRKKHAELEEKYVAVTQERDQLKATLDGILRSRSWKITSPIRRVTESLVK